MRTNLNHSNDQDHLFYEIMKKDKHLHGKSVLQCGARPGFGWRDIFRGFKANGFERFHILEIHKPNVDWLIQEHDELVVHGDIRLIDQYKELDEEYDIITLWHGPEHLTEQEFIDTIPLVEAKTNKAFIVGAPWGFWAQADIKNNPHERHLKHWYPEEWEDLGFEVITFNDQEKKPGPDNHNVMIGIKYV